jgi:DNA-binding XRE family transcriptional regulator
MTNKRTCKRCTVILDSTNNSRACLDCQRETAKVRPKWIVEKSKIDDEKKRNRAAMGKILYFPPRPETARICIYKGMIFKSEQMAIICREKRVGKGLSMDKLAEQIGIGRTTYQYVEAGKTRDPETSTIAKICKYFELDMADYYGEKQND